MSRLLVLCIIWLSCTTLLHVNMRFCSAQTLLQSERSSKASSSLSGVQLKTDNPNYVVMDNGIVQVTLSKQHGFVTGVQYNGIENLLNVKNPEHDRGYWDVVWRKPGGQDNIDRLEETQFTVIMQNRDQVEVSFTKTWNAVRGSTAIPLNIDKRYIMRSGSSGFYMYGILERLQGWPDVNMDQTRIVFKLQSDKFSNMAIWKLGERMMPTELDREHGEPLAYKEAVLLTKPSNPLLRGEVDDKYQYSTENKENKLHGWISNNPPTGFWIITPSQEFFAGGPIKPDLTSHCGPTLLSMFTSVHYTGSNLDTSYRNGEAWKKVFGPVFIYLNSIPSGQDQHTLFTDAQAQMSKEVNSWPYNFPQSKDFPYADKRASVAGQLVIRDRYISANLKWASNAYVGLAAPGFVGSWQTESKGYQFWIQADNQGRFIINNVREGVYNLYAWVPGVIGDYMYELNITIAPGSKINLGLLRYAPPRNGPTLWEIGIPDRSAAEFYVPDSYPTLINRLYANSTSERFRQYGLWERYTDLYPKFDLVYTVGTSDYRRDWFYAHVPRNKGNKIYQTTTWQIIFTLTKVSQVGSYTFQMALASATQCDIEVRFSDKSANPPHFATGRIGKDNAIARHGIHGLYRLYSIDVPSNRLHAGLNTIYLTQARAENPFEGVLYDYIRLEGPKNT